jgi:ubiquinone/menaquinone biosynthesis C-methylase UbiE
MLEIARHRLAESDAGNCDFVVGDADNVPPYHYGVVFERI